MIIHKDKSCKGSFSVDRKTYVVMNRIKKNVFCNNNNGTITDNFLDDLFSKSIIKFKTNVKYDNDTIPADIKLKYLKLDNIDTIIVEYRTSSYLYKTEEIFEKNQTFICPQNYNSNRNTNTHDKLFDNLTTEQKYLDELNGNIMYINNDIYSIIPDIYKNPITSDDIISYTNIKESKNTVLITKFLYGISFVLYVKKYLFSTVTFTDLIKLDLRNKIIKFYDRFYGGENIVDEKLLSIYVNTKTKNDTLVIHFELFNFYSEQNFTSFIAYHERIKYDIFMNMKKQKNLVIYKQINVNDVNIQICKDEPIYRIYKKYMRGLGKKSNLNFFQNTASTKFINPINQLYLTPKKFYNITDKIKPIYYHNTSDGIYTYCSLIILCMIGDKYYDLVIKDITFDYLEFHQSDSRKWIDNIMKYESEKLTSSNIIIDVPQYLEIRLIPIEKPSFIRISVTETYEDYQIINNKLNILKKIDPSLILIFMIKNNKIKLELNKSLLFNYYFEGNIYTADNINNFFIMNKKSLENPQKLFTLWYNPIFEIKNLNKLITYLHNFIQQQDNESNIYFEEYINNLKKMDKYIDSDIYKEYVEKCLIDNQGPILEKIQYFVQRSFNFFIDKININPFLKKILYQKTHNAYLIENYSELVYSLLKNIKPIDENLYKLVSDIFTTNVYTYVMKKLDLFTRNHDDIQNMFNECTTFYDEYSKGTYVKNIRDLTVIHKKNIDILIKKFLFELYDNQIKFSKNYRKEFSQITRYPYFIYAHYPNSPSYSIFHMHIITNRYGSEDVYRTDISYAYFGPSAKRIFTWEYLKNINYSKLDIDLVYASRGIPGDTIESLLEKIKKIVLNNQRDIIINKIPSIENIINAGNALL